jgi:hypothetical protein
MCSNMQRSAAMCNLVQQCAAMCNIQFAGVATTNAGGSVNMNEGDAGSLETVRRTGTAELRRRFDDITRFLGEGYNHKQICEHLNQQGLAIPYSQYRAIMTRLRRERGVSSNRSPGSRRLASSPDVHASRPAGVVSPVPLDRPREHSTQETKILWDPMSEVKWK